MGAALVGDSVKLLGAFGGDGHIAGFFQESERRVHNARTRTVPVGGLFLDELDDFVAVAGGLRDQGQRYQPQIALRQHAPGAHVVRVHAAAAVAAAKAKSAKSSAPMPPRRPSIGATMSMHFSILHF